MILSSNNSFKREREKEEEKKRKDKFVYYCHLLNSLTFCGHSSVCSITGGIIYVIAILEEQEGGESDPFFPFLLSFYDM